MSREITLFSAKQQRNKIQNSMILETLKSNPHICCPQCSLKKFSETNLMVVNVSEGRFVWETGLELGTD
jgi:hypothetical protein